MAKTPSNHGKDWTAGDIKRLGQLARQNTPTRVAALKLGRTPDAVAQKAMSKGSRSRRQISAPTARVKSSKGSWACERPQFMRSHDLWPLATFPGRRRRRFSALPSKLQLPVRARATHTLRQERGDLSRSCQIRAITQYVTG